MLKLVDKPDLGSGASAYGFESLHPHMEDVQDSRTSSFFESRSRPLKSLALKMKELCENFGKLENCGTFAVRKIIYDCRGR